MSLSKLVELPEDLTTASPEGDYTQAQHLVNSHLTSNPSADKQQVLTTMALHAGTHKHTAFIRASLTDADNLTIGPSNIFTNQDFAFYAIYADDVDLLQNYLNEGTLPLDIGSAYTGDILNYAAWMNSLNTGAFVIARGVDINSDACKHGRARYGCDQPL